MGSGIEQKSKQGKSRGPKKLSALLSLRQEVARLNTLLRYSDRRTRLYSAAHNRLHWEARKAIAYLRSAVIFMRSQCGSEESLDLVTKATTHLLDELVSVESMIREEEGR